MSSSLRKTSIHGLTWGFIDTLAGSGISFIIGVMLARILSPDIFGTVGMITIIFAFANTFIDSGFSVGLIRKLHCTQDDYSTVFYFNIAVSLLLYSVLFLSAPFIAVFFKVAGLVSIVRVLGLVIIVDSFSIVQKVILTKAIDFRTQTIISIVASIISGTAGIYLAYAGYGVWSLVVQMMIKQVLNCLLLWVLAKWRPSFYFSAQIFREFFSFGSRLLLSGLITTLQSNIYYIVIGRYFSTAAVGYYTRAESMNAIVANNLSGNLEKVFFPVLSTIQTDSIRLKAAFKKVIRTSFFITFLALISLAAIAKPFIYLLIGPKWNASVIMLQLICISTIFLPLNAVNLNILKIKGQSRLILNLQIIKTTLFAVTVVTGILYGIITMLVVRIFVTLVAYFINSWYTGRLIDYSLKEQLADVAPYFAAELFIALSMFGISFLPINFLQMIAVQLFTGAILFFIIFEYKKFAEYLEIKGIVLGFMQRWRIAKI